MSNKNFTEDNLTNLIERIKEIPPIVAELQVFPQGYEVIYNNVGDLDSFREKELKDRAKITSETGHHFFSGITIRVIEKDDELKINQGRAIYSDGSSKIINIFEVK